MKNSTIVYVLLIIAVISLFIYSISSLFIAIAAIYFAGRVKEKEDKKLGNRLIMLVVVVIAGSLVFNTISQLSGVMNMFEGPKQRINDIWSGDMGFPSEWEIKSNIPPDMGAVSMHIGYLTLENSQKDLNAEMSIWVFARFDNYDEDDNGNPLNENIAGGRCSISKTSNTGIRIFCYKEDVEVITSISDDELGDQELIHQATLLTSTILNKIK
jgi:hypothetical protein